MDSPPSRIGRRLYPRPAFPPSAGIGLKVAIVGIGVTPFRIATPEFSWKELMYDAAVRAYEDAGIDPRTDVDSFVTCAEDYWEGFGIFDEFVPDQLGATMRPTCTVSGDGIQGLASAVMQIRTGIVETVVVEAHSKVSDLLTYNGVVQHALDPVWNKPLGGNPHYVAGLEMGAYLRASRITAADCAAVVEKNRRAALLNPEAPHGARITAKDVARSRVLFDPLRELDVSPLADGAVVLVLASERRARGMVPSPVWVRGIGWASDTPWLESRSWTDAAYLRAAAERAYGMARLRDPARTIRLTEVDDRFSYKEPQHLEALGLSKRGTTARRIRRGDFGLDGTLPVNVSGGSLGCGNVLEASGLHRVAEVARQLRGEAGRRQVDGVRTGVAASWRGIPTATGAVAVLGVGR